MTTRQRQLRWIVTVFALIVIADQITKEIIIRTIPEGSVTFAGREETFFFLTHERNPGLVGGAFRDYPGVAYIAPIVATLVLIYLFRHLDPASRAQSLAYGMITGGAIGNIIDRFRIGSVTDFIQVHFYFIPFDFPWKRYPAFNVADSAICIGVVMLILCWRRMELERLRRESEQSDASRTD